MYKVIHKFKDLEDDNYIYDPNGTEKQKFYPREGLEPTSKRIKELSSKKNKIGKVLIVLDDNNSNNNDNSNENSDN